MIRSLAAKFEDFFLEKCMNQSVEENYEEFSNHLDTLMRDHVPFKVINPRYHTPWLNPTIKRMSMKKQRLFNRVKRSNKRSHWDKYKSHKKDTLKAIRRARWSYINDILQLSLDDNNPKPFWRYVRSQRQDNVGVSALKAGGRLFSDGLTKAELLSKQFSSVFTKEDKSNVDKLFGPYYPDINDLTINIEGVEKLLFGLNPSKASGPDEIPCRLLKELSHELAPVLTAIFSQSLDSGILPKVWSKAFITRL